MAEAAKQIRSEHRPEPSVWKELAEKGDLGPLDEFSKEVRRLHRDLHNRYRDSGYKDESVSERLGPVHVFLREYDRARQALQEQAVRSAVQAAAGGTFGAAGAVTAYAAWSGLGKADLEDLVDHLLAIRDGVTPMMLRGNRVEQVHGEKLWQAMNRLLDEALEESKKGNPPEVDLQYYELTSPELVGKLARVAKAGCKVRINVDPTRLQPGGSTGDDIGDTPRKLRPFLQLAAMKDVDVGISLYPVARQLGSGTRLMHRKLLRVGDKVLLSGMNANTDSGENVDAGYLIEGPAARRLVQNFARDLRVSMGASLEDLCGESQLERFEDRPVAMDVEDMAALFDAYAGPSPPGTDLPEIRSFEDLDALATRAGLNLKRTLAQTGDEAREAVEKALRNGDRLELSAYGKNRLGEVVRRALEAVGTRENLRRLQDVRLPSGRKAGETVVGVGDLPVEREALMLHAIATAEEFIYVPTFVITRAVAAALVARRDELRARGRELDIRVIADPGVYPHGGTPNEYGVKYLEDAGIPVRWATLPRTGEHDRKIHAKQILTDKLEFFGSTNLSNKGMRENWEISGVVQFDPADPQAMDHREESRRAFLKLWENEALELDSRKLAERWNAHYRGPDREVRVEEARTGALRKIIGAIEAFERESADFIREKAKDPAVAARAREYELAGMAPGYALLQAVEQEMGTEAYYQALHGLPSYRDLLRLSSG